MSGRWQVVKSVINAASREVSGQYSQGRVMVQLVSQMPS